MLDKTNTAADTTTTTTTTDAVIKMPARLECSKCGAATDAACDCGEPYVPAGARAAKAVAENPQKSDRAIAAETGVSHHTVAKARRSTGKQLPVDARLGLDGKVRRLPVAKPKTAQEPCERGAITALTMLVGLFDEIQFEVPSRQAREDLKEIRHLIRVCGREDRKKIRCLIRILERALRAGGDENGHAAF
jgi:hypothetical protein